MATKKLFEQIQSGGSAQYLITGTGGAVYLKATDAGAGNNTDERNGSQTSTENLTGDVGADQVIAITKIHWTGAFTLTVKLEGGASTTNIDFDGNGTWSQFNGWTPLISEDDVLITNGNGSIFMEVKKISGYEGRSDCSA